MSKMIVMIILVSTFTFLFADGTVPNGTGTSSNPYQIDNLDNLLWVSTNASKWDKYFIQTSHIDASATSGWNSGEGFIPIGNSTTEFTGVYDGDGYNINGLFIGRSSTDDQGLFGRVNGATMKNLGVKNCNITGSTRVGAIASVCLGSSEITNCFSTGTVNGAETTGGLVGFLRYGSSIKYSNSTCDVSATTSSVGGLVGKTNNNAEIGESFFSGTVSGGNSAGGIVGESLGAAINHCYSTGNVSGSSYIGGLVGWLDSSSIHYCYSTGFVDGNSFLGGLVAYDFTYPSPINYSFWDTDTTGQASSQGGMGRTTSEMKTLSTYTDWGWDFAGETTNGTADIWGMYRIHNEGYPFHSWQGYEHYPPAGTEPAGSGTAGAPYILTQFAHLHWLSSHPDAWNAVFRMDADIDASETQTWSSGKGLAPIGVINFDFTGTFDGNGYAVSNLYIRRLNSSAQALFGRTLDASVSDLELENIFVRGTGRIGGLIGRAGNTSIINCSIDGTVRDSNTSGLLVGGLVGLLQNGSIIESCVVSTDVYGYREVGGIVGKSGNSTIESSFFNGTIDGDSYVGGLAGIIENESYVLNSGVDATISAGFDCGGFIATADDSSIENCYSIADISGPNYRIGGFVSLAGGTTAISNCYSKGSLTFDGYLSNSIAGGFAAVFYNGMITVENCYSANTMTGTAPDIGGFAASATEYTEVTNCFWDTDLSGLTESAGGTGLTTNEMKDINSYLTAGWDFMNLWEMYAGYNDGYPYLQWQFSAPPPQISVNPTAIHYGDVEIGSLSTEQFTITNDGERVLTGSITTPEGYSVELAAREFSNGTKQLKAAKHERNILDFSVNPTSSKTFNLTFEPQAEQSYNDDVVIENNAEDAILLAVTGNGVLAAPEMVVTPDSLTASLNTNETTTLNFTVENIGEAVLNYSANISYNPPTVRAERDYCAINYSNTSDDWISNVQFNTINNSSGSVGYEDFTHISTEVIRGQSYELVVTIQVEGSWTQYCTAWFDWNQNTDFTDVGEAYDFGDNGGAAGAYQFSQIITIPEDAALGATRLRIAEEFSSYPSPCTNMTFGEAEDYTIVIIEDYPMSWLTLNGGESYSNAVNQGNQETITVGFDSSELDYGTYTADIVITSDDPANPEEIISVTLNVEGEIVPPEGVEILVSDTEIIINWEPVAGVSSYVVYSSDNPYTGFVIDETGTFANTSWSAPISSAKKFYQVRSYIDD